jgi:hypothetical protein
MAGSGIGRQSVQLGGRRIGALLAGRRLRGLSRTFLCRPVLGVSAGRERKCGDRNGDTAASAENRRAPEHCLISLHLPHLSRGFPATLRMVHNPGNE